MCSSPEAVSAGLPLLRAAYGGVIGGYANLGYNPTGPVANRPVLSNLRPQQRTGHHPGRRLLPGAHRPVRIRLAQRRRGATLPIGVSCDHQRR